MPQEAYSCRKFLVLTAAKQSGIADYPQIADGAQV